MTEPASIDATPDAIPSTVTIAAGSQATTPYERGRDIYNYRCYFCHGYSGDAKTVASTYLSPPPRAFTATDPQRLSRDAMVEAVTNGKTGTAMMGFSSVLTADDIGAVVDFVRAEFMGGERKATRYHTAANGWPNHERYSAAFPFVGGELSLDVAVESLTPAQREGRKLYMSACITCHDRARDASAADIWNRRSISFPRGMYDHRAAEVENEVDAVSGATPYAQHDVAPVSPAVARARGEQLFLDNCAFCHGADGTGKNWIGSFLQPHPRDFSSEEFRARITRDGLLDVIAQGLPGTTMPAWQNVLTAEELVAVADYVWVTWIEPQSTVPDRSQAAPESIR